MSGVGDEIDDGVAAALEHERVVLGVSSARYFRTLLIRQPIDDNLIGQVVDTLVRGLAAA